MGQKFYPKTLHILDTNVHSANSGFDHRSLALGSSSILSLCDVKISSLNPSEETVSTNVILKQPNSDNGDLWSNFTLLAKLG